MNEEEQKEWLKSLKVGDLICKFVSSTWYDSNRYYSTVKVKSVTKGGNIRLENGDLIKLGYTTGYQPITKEVMLINKEASIRKKLKRKFESVNVSKLDIEKVNQILEILGDE